MIIKDNFNGTGHNVAFTYSKIMQKGKNYMFKVTSSFSGVIGYHVFSTTGKNYPEGIELIRDYDEAFKKFRFL